MISIVILNYNGSKITKKCIGSIIRSDFKDYEIIVIDNNSETQDFCSLLDIQGIRVVRQVENKYFAGGMNEGIKRANGNIIICMNNDIIVDRDFLSYVNAIFKQTNINLAIPYIKDKQGKWVGANKVRFGRCYASMYSKMDYLNGCCIIFRKSVLDKIGLFDESFTLFYEDVDISFRAKKFGYKLNMLPLAKVTHIGGETLKKKDKWWIKWQIAKSRLRFMWRYYTGYYK